MSIQDKAFPPDSWQKARFSFDKRGERDACPTVPQYVRALYLKASECLGSKPRATLLLCKQCLSHILKDQLEQPPDSVPRALRRFSRKSFVPAHWLSPAIMIGMELNDGRETTSPGVDSNDHGELSSRAMCFLTLLSWTVDFTYFNRLERMHFGPS